VNVLEPHVKLTERRPLASIGVGACRDAGGRILPKSHDRSRTQRHSAQPKRSAVTLDQFRVFVAVAERQHVTQASRDLNLAQSAVSHAISALEGEFQVKLFDRVGRRIELTAAGQLLLEEARGVLACAATVRLKMTELADQRRGTLHVHVSQTIASYWLPRHLMFYRQRYPLVDVQMVIGNTDDVARALTDGTAELGFVEGTIEDTAIVARQVARDQLVLVVSADHAWAKRGDITAADFRETEWVIREVGSGTRAQFEAVLEANGLNLGDLTVALELPSNEAVRAAVESGLAATVFSASVAAPSIEAGLLVHVPLALPERSFLVARHRERSLSRNAEAMLELLKAG
jgi:DNA-binding transcriptional LysR family regulator